MPDLKVVAAATPRRPRPTKPKDRWLWRQAMIVVSTLPETEGDALKVLEYARGLLVEGPPSIRPA